MDNLLEKFFVYLTEQSSTFAYVVIFGILVACGVGFPLPEDIPLIAAGYLCYQGDMEIPFAFLVTVAGVLIGDTVLFYLGKKMGLRFLNTRRVQALFKPEKIRRVRAYFRKYGDKIVFFARFVAGFRAIAFFMAGAMKVKYRKFILLDGLAAMISVPIWIGVGYFLGYSLGDEINAIMKSVKKIKTGVLLVVGIVVIVVLIRFFIKVQRARRAEAALIAKGKA